MSLDATIQAILDLQKVGSLAVCEYLAVEWNNGANTEYYGTDAYSRLTPYRDVRNYTGGDHIKAKIKGNGFQKFEISGDIRTDMIPVKFEDADGAIKALYKLYGPPRIEWFRYYPAKNYRRSIWWGQMIKVRTSKFTFSATLKNGTKGKERMLPGSPRPSECRFAPYFATADTADKVATSGCPYDRQCGGSVGNLDPGTSEPYKACSGTRAACIVRLDTDNFFGGTDISAAPFISDTQSGYLSQTKGNRTIRNKAISWGFGTKWFAGSDIVLWARELNSSHPDQGFVRGLWHGPEGPLQSISAIEVDGVTIGYEHINIRLGTRGQAPTAYPGTTQRFSSISVVFARRGPVNPATITQAQMTLRFLSQLFAIVAVFTDDDPLTFTRKWTDDIVWCLIEMYTNQKCGLQFEHARFNIAKALIASAACSTKKVTMSFTNADGDEITAAGRRATFDAVLDGRPADEQILNICRAGRISPPFQDNGKYSIVCLKPFTSGELDDAPIFRDYGPDKNIVFSGADSVIFDEIPDDKLTNEVTLTFDESTNFDIARPIVGNDPDQQRKAAQLAGNNAINVVPKQLAGVGIRNEHQAIRLLYHNIFFGDFESGGTKNNATAPIVVPFEWTYAVTRYGPLKLDLQHANVPINPTTDAPFEWFRVMSIQAIDTNNAVINVAAYNKEFYEALETESDITNDGGGGSPCTDDSECGEGFFCNPITHRCMPIVDGGGCLPDFTADYDADKGLLVLSIPPC